MSDFYYNVWNLFNHVKEVSADPTGKEIYFYLDGVWKIHDLADRTCVKRIDSAVDMCAWLNANGFSPSPNGRVKD
jgi:hypothetical protein